MKKVVEHHKYGEIIVCRTKGLRRISISLRPPSTVRLNCPYGVALSEAMAFLDSKQDVIEAKLAKYKTLGVNKLIELPYSTRLHTLRYEPSDDDVFIANKKGDEIIVSFLVSRGCGDTDIQKKLRELIEQIWRYEAKVLLPQKVEKLARCNGFSYGRLTFRNAKSRWGSCSSYDSISLSIQLMKLPDSLIDYVILHELCHTVHKNHSQNFYDLLDKVTDGAHSQLNKELRSFR